MDNTLRTTNDGDDTKGESARTTNFWISPLGGLQRRGRWTMGANVLSVTLLGGADLDLSEAALAAPTVTLTKISAVGGVQMIVPANAKVEVSGFNLIGRRTVQPGTPSADGPTIHIRAFGVFGGVDVRRAPSAPDAA